MYVHVARRRGERAPVYQVSLQCVSTRVLYVVFHPPPPPHRCLCLSHRQGRGRPTAAGLEAEPRQTGSTQVGGAQPTKKGELSTGTKMAAPFILGEGLPLIPAKVVAKV